MIDLLGAIFDGANRPCVVVSSYDQTITYVNRQAASGDPQELVGGRFTELMERWNYDAAQSAILKVIDDLNGGEKYLRTVDGAGWWVASAVPCADPSQPEVFGSAHEGPDDPMSLRRALVEHRILNVRVAVAIEHMRVARLLNAAGAAVADANRRMNWLGGLLTEAGTRPINPRDAEQHPL